MHHRIRHAVGDLLLATCLLWLGPDAVMLQPCAAFERRVRRLLRVAARAWAELLRIPGRLWGPSG